MKKLQNQNLKIAVQKSGRLSQPTLEFLKQAGLEFESYKQQLFTTCNNFPLEILYMRDDDIPNYVIDGSADLGIVGGNVLEEMSIKVDRLLGLGFGKCSLVVAVPKESKLSLDKLNGKQIATSYPNITEKYFKAKKIPVSISLLNGSVEIAPTMGIADAIVDMMSSGSTLAMNDLIPIETVIRSEATLIRNPTMSASKKELLDRLMTRFNGVLAAKQYKYIMMNAPEDKLEEIKRVIPGLKSPTISRLAIPGWLSVQAVVKEDVFWETMEEMKKLGAAGIIVLPIEKVIV